MGESSLRVELLYHTELPEEKVAIAAKVCYSSAGMTQLKEGIAGEDQAGFVKKLMQMGHYSPVEHASFTFGVEGVSRSLLAQITRHRLASFSVKSQRYVKESGSEGEVFDYIIPPSIESLGPEFVAEFERQMKEVQSWYDYWLDVLSARDAAGDKSAREDARFVLPNATETKFIVTMNARELHHFFNVRCCNRAQWEIRGLATEMLRLVKGVAPVLFENAGPRCMQGACPEGNFSCGRTGEVRQKFKNLA
jgi:thymidylate synthase (FAD)